MSDADHAKLIQVTVTGLWVAWLLSWWLAARWYAPATKRLSLLAQIPDRALVTVGAALLLLWAPPGRFGPVWTDRLYGFGFPVAWALIGCMVLGIAIMWWARITLGRLWSGSITQKEGHRIVESGPYAFVRHPIYTGLLVMAAATAALKATWFGFAGVALMTLGFYVKARAEERFLSQDLGPEYEAYRARVPMLIPFIGV